jgi:hypothetical protein
VVGPDRLVEILGDSDAVVLSAPATSETVGLTGREELAAMRQGAILCNVARAHSWTRSRWSSRLSRAISGRPFWTSRTRATEPQEPPLVRSPRLRLAPRRNLVGPSLR